MKPIIRTARFIAINNAFTRMELLALVTAIGLLTVTGLPMLAGNKRVSERVVCVSNLERIGQATHAWIGDHGDVLFPFAVDAMEGGLRTHPLRQNAYISFVILSNYLDAPSHLVCPADEETLRSAAGWAQFDTPLYRANALSYFIGTDVYTLDQPKSVLSGDRHFLGAYPENCGTAQVRAFAFPGRLNNASANQQLRWNTQTIHGESGNMLLADGQVVQTSSAGLRTLLSNPSSGDANSSNHLLPPR